MKMSAKTEKTTISFRAPVSTKSTLEVLASDKGMTVTDYLNWLVERELNESAILDAITDTQRNQQKLNDAVFEIQGFLQELVGFQNEHRSTILDLQKEQYINNVLTKQNYQMLCSALGITPAVSVKDLEDSISGED